MISIVHISNLTVRHELKLAIYCFCLYVIMCVYFAMLMLPADSLFGYTFEIYNYRISCVQFPTFFICIFARVITYVY